MTRDQKALRLAAELRLFNHFEAADQMERLARGNQELGRELAQLADEHVETREALAQARRAAAETKLAHDAAVAAASKAVEEATAGLIALALALGTRERSGD